MRRTILLFTVMALALVLASGTAFAALKIGTEGPDTLTSTLKRQNGGMVPGIFKILLTDCRSPFLQVGSIPTSTSTVDVA